MRAQRDSAGAPPYSWSRRSLVTEGWKYVLLEGEESTLDPDVLVREELFQLVETRAEEDRWGLDEGPDLLAEEDLSTEVLDTWERLAAQLEADVAARPFEY